MAALYRFDCVVVIVIVIFIVIIIIIIIIVIDSTKASPMCVLFFPVIYNINFLD